MNAVLRTLRITTPAMEGKLRTVPIVMALLSQEYKKLRMMFVVLSRLANVIHGSALWLPKPGSDWATQEAQNFPIFTDRGKFTISLTTR